MTLSVQKDACYSPSLLSVDEALTQLLEQASPITETELISIEDALGRVLAEDIKSTINVPGYDNSAMDGYAVRSEDCSVSGTKLEVTQRIPAGQTGRQLEPGCAARIFTGAPVPPGADAVVMQECCIADGNKVTINTEVCSGNNVRRAGEDIKQGSTVLETGTSLRQQELGLIASVGLSKISVVRKLQVAVFFTGDELVEPGNNLQDGQIYDSNRYTLRGFLQTLGCEIIDLGIVPDNLEATRTVLEKAASCADLVLTSGGVSVGEEDYVRIALEALGTLSLWRIAMKPGKPVAFGSIGKTLFLGLPGNPVSVFVTSLVFAKPLILKMQGLNNFTSLYVHAKAAFECKAGKRQEYLRARLEQGDSGPEVAIFKHQGSGVLSSACWANGLVEVLPEQGISKGDSVRFIPF